MFKEIRMIDIPTGQPMPRVSPEEVAEARKVLVAAMVEFVENDEVLTLVLGIKVALAHLGMAEELE